MNLGNKEKDFEKKTCDKIRKRKVGSQRREELLHFVNFDHLQVKEEKKKTEKKQKFETRNENSTNLNIHNVK